MSVNGEVVFGKRPEGVVQLAAEAALSAATSAIRAGGGELVGMCVMIQADGLPEGEVGAATASKGLGDERELLGFILAQAHHVGKSVGIKIDFHGVGREES